MNHREMIAATLPRETLLAVLADAPDAVLRGAVLALLSGATAEAPASPATTSAAPKAPKASTTATPATTATEAPRGNTEIAKAIAALAVEGFAIGELAQLTGLDARASALRTAIAAAEDQGTLHRHGERRFLRYGQTQAIAKARSEKDQKGG